MEREWGVVPREVLAAEDGIDFLHGIIEGRHPAPPMARLMGMELAEVEPGRAVFAGTPRFDHANPIGSIHAGFAATLLDSAVACAVHSLLKAGQGYTTLEIKLNLVRALTEKTGPVLAEGRIVHCGRQVATAEGDLRDEAGRLYAHAVTTCLIFPIGAAG